MKQKDSNEIRKLDDSFFDKKERGGYGGKKRKYKELRKVVETKEV